MSNADRHFQRTLGRDQVTALKAHVVQLQHQLQQSGGQLRKMAQQIAELDARRAHYTRALADVVLSQARPGTTGQAMLTVPASVTDATPLRVTARYRVDDAAADRGRVLDLVVEPQPASPPADQVAPPAEAPRLVLARR